MSEQIYHHYTKWEDFQAGMWRKVGKKEGMRYLEDAIRFTGDHQLYGEWMIKVVDEWPNACEQNLSDIDQNRKAWIGHAAACLCFGCPESITRQAWAFLTKDQQDKANESANIAIKKWESITGFGK